MYLVRVKKKVFVGLSGGVDSAVSAALLKEQGYDVVGVFIKIWQPEFIECTWREDRLDAMRVCAALYIPFREIDLSEEYRTEVVEKMIASYERGVTPNPDVLCNRSIKFGPFMRWALEEGAEFIATGHYAQSVSGTLLRGKDSGKDQSYFLYSLTRSELDQIIFPVGNLEKKEVRTLATRFALPVASKKDSQGLCFVGDVTLPEFLSRYIKLKKGEVLDTSGAVIGVHDGAVLYTKGQRHGFLITLPKAQKRPQYVVGTDVENNTVTVSPKSIDTLTDAVTLTYMHWIGEIPELPAEFSVQTRYREKPVSTQLSVQNEKIAVTFAEPHLASSGQSLVVYDGEKCLGGGEIA